MFDLLLHRCKQAGHRGLRDLYDREVTREYKTASQQYVEEAVTASLSTGSCQRGTALTSKALSPVVDKPLQLLQLSRKGTCRPASTLTQ